MPEKMENCWEILKCGREKDGAKADELGECIASKEGLGHSCWIIAGTFCGGKVQGTVAQKRLNCMQCDVYKRYNRLTGTRGKRVAQKFPTEERKYRLLKRSLYRKS